MTSRVLFHTLSPCPCAMLLDAVSSHGTASVCRYSLSLLKATFA